MQNKTYTSFLIILILWSIYSCSTRKEKVQLCLRNLKYYVDSISTINDIWKTQPDSLFAEVPIDSINTSWDTAVVSVEDKKNISILQVNPCGKKIINDYTTIVFETNKLSRHLSDESKKDFEKSVRKFESLLLKDSDSLLALKYEYLRNYDFVNYRKIKP